MSFPFWFRPAPASRCRRRAPRRRPPPCALALEVLEDRSLPSLFGPPTPFPVGSGANSVAVGDFNGDGVPDLAAPNIYDNTVSVLLGDGRGGFSAAPGSPVSVGSSPLSVAVGDFNGDGFPDLAVASSFGGTVSVLLGDGRGGLSPDPYSPVSVGTSPSAVAVGDFNGDGISDLAVANEGDGTVSVLLGEGHLGIFYSAYNSPITVGPSPAAVAVGDFNRDGIPDLAVANYSGDSVSVLLGEGGGGFSPAPYSPVSVGSNPASVAVGDFDKDGFPDLAVANAGDGTVSVLLNNYARGFHDAVTYPAGASPISLAVGDFNHDGGLDLAVANYPSTVSVLLNQTPVTTTAVGSSTYTYPAAVGTLVTYTATVYATQPGQSVTPTGVVVFEDSDTVLGTGTLDANGHASFSTLAAETGYHEITAHYLGDPNFTGSFSPPLNQLVNQDATRTLLTASAGPALAGQPVTLTALVSPPFPSAGTPTGTVLFTDSFGDGGSAILGTATLNGGVATLTTGALAPGGHSLSAIYAGDDDFTGSTAATLAETINNPAPVLRSLDTTALPEDSAGFTLALNGTGFLGSSVVQWNGTPLTVLAASGTQIQVMVPAALLADEGTALVTVSNPGPGGGLSLPQTFTVTDAPLAASPVNISVLGNKRFAGVVATFTDGNPGATAAELTAIILWDNGKADFGTLGGGNGGPFTVSGTHTFGAFTNVHTVQVTIFDKGGRTATVTDNLIDPPGPPQSPPPAGGGDPGAAALPGDGLPTARPEHHRHHRHHRHHAGHGRGLPKRQQPGGPLAG